MFIRLSFVNEWLAAQRLAAQLLGRLRSVVTILAGNLKPHIGVRSLSRGQVSCSRVLGNQSQI